MINKRIGGDTDEKMGTTSASGGSACRTVCFFTERGCMDILDMVAVGVSDGNGGNAADWETVCRI